MGIEHTNKERENFYGDPINVRMLHSTNFKEIFSQLLNIEKLHAICETFSGPWWILWLVIIP